PAAPASVTAAVKAQRTTPIRIDPPYLLIHLYGDDTDKVGSQSTPRHAGRNMPFGVDVAYRNFTGDCQDYRLKRSRSANFWILPLAVRGIASITTTSVGFL